MLRRDGTLHAGAPSRDGAVLEAWSRCAPAGPHRPCEAPPGSLGETQVECAFHGSAASERKSRVPALDKVPGPADSAD